jgi:hypothetical protein
VRLLRSRAGQTQQVAQQTAGTWEQITAAIEVGEASLQDLSRLQMAAMPTSYLARCWAAELPHSIAHRV